MRNSLNYKIDKLASAIIVNLAVASLLHWVAWQYVPWDDEGVANRWDLLGSPYFPLSMSIPQMTFIAAFLLITAAHKALKVVVRPRSNERSGVA